MAKRIAILSLAVLLAFSVQPASAQTATPPPEPVYIVQQGDTLWSIASRFNLSVADLQAANHLTNASIFIGDRLIIPGLEGLTGTLTASSVPYGETLRSLSRQYRIDETLLRKLNHIVSPAELYAGYSLTLLQQDSKPAWTERADLKPNGTLLELAVEQNTDPWTIAQINGLPGTWDALPGDVLYLPAGSSTSGSTGLPTAFTAALVDPLPTIQGTTTEIQVVASQGVSLGGEWIGFPLHFFQQGDQSWIALQGIDAMTEPGLYPLRIEATLGDGSVQSYEQLVPVTSGNYPHDPPLYVDPGMIDPKITGPELQQVESIVAPATAQKFWDGTFTTPASLYAASTFFTSRFGSRRTYFGIGTNLTVDNYHTGVDFGGGVGLPITAPASGKVIFAGPLTVRGNATIIDHGWGIYSAIYHQSAIQVTVGQMVKQGEQIGLVGGTGRVTGPHLHWELWVNGVTVDPLPWLTNQFPH